MHRQPLLQLLAENSRAFPEEREVVERSQRFVRSHSRCFDRGLWAGHVWGSAWLVNFVVPREEFEAAVTDYAEPIARNAPPTVRAVRGMVDACFDSADYREGRRAFKEKRPPRFEGR